MMGPETRVPPVTKSGLPMTNDEPTINPALEERAAPILFNRICPNLRAMPEPRELNIVSLPYDMRQRSRLRISI